MREPKPIEENEDRAYIRDLLRAFTRTPAAANEIVFNISMLAYFTPTDEDFNAAIDTVFNLLLDQYDADIDAGIS